MVYMVRNPQASYETITALSFPYHKDLLYWSKYLYLLLIMPQWMEPRRYMEVIVMCVYDFNFACISLQRFKKSAKTAMQL